MFLGRYFGKRYPLPDKHPTRYGRGCPTDFRHACRSLALTAACISIHRNSGSRDSGQRLGPEVQGGS
jgi:hypothetical protein